MASDTNEANDAGDEGLDLFVSRDGAIDVIDEALGTWLVRIEPVPVGEEHVDPELRAIGRGVLLGLGETVPALTDALKGLQAASAESGAGIRVMFSPDVQKGLADGTYRFMQSGGRTLATAVDSSHHVVEHGTVVAAAGVGAASLTATGGAGAAGAAGVGAAATGATLGTAAGAGAAAASAPLWPIAAVVGIAVAASIAEQRWLQATFAEIQSSLARIETRLRDDDLGRLAAANHLVDLIDRTSVTAPLAPQLQAELAVARQTVESIFWSRRRYVERFAAELSRLQDEHEARKGKADPWAGKRAMELVGGATDELVVYLASLITRGRVTAVTALLVAGEGDGATALRMLDDLTDTTRTAYYDIARRVHALDRTGPEAGVLRKIADVVNREDEHVVGAIHQLRTLMDATIGDRLPERDPVLSLPA